MAQTQTKTKIDHKHVAFIKLLNVSDIFLLIIELLNIPLHFYLRFSNSVWEIFLRTIIHVYQVLIHFLDPFKPFNFLIRSQVLTNYQKKNGSIFLCKILKRKYFITLVLYLQYQKYILAFKPNTRYFILVSLDTVLQQNL